MPGGANEKRNHDGNRGEHDDDPLQDLDAPGRRLVGHLAEDAVEVSSFLRIAASHDSK